MIKKYGEILSKSLLLMLAYVVCHVAYLLIYQAIMKYVRFSSSYANLFAGQFIGKLLIALYIVPITAMLVCKLGMAKTSISQSLKKWFLPYFAWTFITVSLIGVLPGIYFSMHGHFAVSGVLNVITMLLLMKFALWLPMGINEGFSFKDSLVSSWKLLGIGWALAICAAGFILSFITPHISMLTAKAGIRGFAHLAISGIVSAVLAYLLLVFNITVYWHILRKEGKIQA